MHIYVSCMARVIILVILIIAKIILPLSFNHSFIITHIFFHSNGFAPINWFSLFLNFGCFPDKLIFFLLILHYNIFALLEQLKTITIAKKIVAYVKNCCQRCVPYSSVTYCLRQQFFALYDYTFENCCLC